MELPHAERQSEIAQAPSVWDAKSYGHPFVAVSLTLGPPWPKPGCQQDGSKDLMDS